MNKLKQAAQQILEALEGIGFVSDYWNEKVTALRDALAEPELNLNCKSVQKRLATVWGYVKAEQAEQEPYAYEVWDANDQVLILIYASCLKEFYWIEQDDIARKLYAAPARTKDLTDEELWEAAKTAKSNDLIDAFRAVIAAHKEKQK